MGMWWTIGKLALRVSLVLWMAALGGILGSNLMASIGTLFFVPENEGFYVQPWAHAGWFVGTILFIFGAATGRLRLINGTGLGGQQNQAAKGSTSIRREGLGPTEVVEDPVPIHAAQHEGSDSFLQGVFVGGLAGGFLGLLLGANLLIFWFSLAHSPFAPKHVVSSVEVVRERQPGSVFERPVMRSSHPISLYLCLTPAAVGMFAGATAAGVLAWKYRVEPNRPQ